MSVRLRKWTNKEGVVLQRWSVDVQIQLPGRTLQRVREFSPVNTRRGAEQFERQLRQSLLDGSYGKEAEPTPTTSFESFSKVFIEDAKNHNKPSTIANKEQHLKCHLLPFFGSMALSEIKLADIERFKSTMLAKKSESRKRRDDSTKQAKRRRYGNDPKELSRKSVNNSLGILSKFLHLAVEHEVISHAPKVHFFKGKNLKIDFLSFEESKRALASIDPEFRHALLLGLHAGLRIGEIIGLRWQDIDWSSNNLTVQQTIWKNQIGTPKGGRTRSISMTAKLSQALKDARHLRGEYVLCTAEGGHFQPGSLKWPLKRALLKAGVTRPPGQSITWHTLRHTYASHLTMKGASLKVVQELLGHSTIEMTMRYAHLSPESKQQAVYLLDYEEERVAS